MLYITKYDSNLNLVRNMQKTIWILYTKSSKSKESANVNNDQIVFILTLLYTVNRTNLLTKDLDYGYSKQ